MTAATSPAFTVTLAAAQITLFSLDEAAFTRWCDAKGDELECDVPTRSNPSAGAALSDLFHSAKDAAVIIGDNAFELDVYGDDDDENSGFYAVLKNVTGGQRLVGLTSGWTEVPRVDDGDDARRSAREHLDEICTVANDVLRAVGVNPTPAAKEHQHFGYWINRALGTARCYQCQHQFIGTDTTAEDWTRD